MTHRHGVRLVAAGMALGVALAASHAIAGGFAVREQSATHQGSSFAGSAAGNDLSSMFWNPAAVTNKAGINSESHGALIIGNSEINATAGNGLRFGLEPNSGNIAQSALVTTSYFNYQLSPSLYVGLSMNAPFGLTTKPDNDPYYGSLFARTSKLLTINATPTVGYKVMPGVSVAAGVQVQYIQAKLSRRGIQGEVGTVEGDDVAFGFTAGLMLEPARGTKIGVGFRSSIAHRLAGDFNLSNNGFATADITAEADMPELVTVSLRQAVTPALTLLGTVEWTNWSRLKTLDIKCRERAGACAVGGAGSILTTEELNYDDGWFFSAGLEYQWTPSLLVRTGVAYELSPITSDEDRGLRIPDNDRVWLSLGATYQWSQTMSFDVGYSHVFVEDGGIVGHADDPTFRADTKAHVDILAASVKMKLQ